MAVLVRSLFVLALLVFGLAAPAWAENKLAFVVGIDAYPNLEAEAQLQRAVADATAVSAALNNLGVKVTTVTRNQTLDTILNGLDTFKAAVQPGDTVMICYAGHGVSLDDGIYLIPADIGALGPGDERRLKRMALSERELADGHARRGRQNRDSGVRRLPQQSVSRRGAADLGGEPGRRTA